MLLPAFFAAFTSFKNWRLKSTYSFRSFIVIGVLCPVIIMSALFLNVSYAFCRLSAIATALPPLFASNSGMFLPEKTSPAHTIRSDGNRTHVSPFVLPRPKKYTFDLVAALKQGEFVLERARGQPS